MNLRRFYRLALADPKALPELSDRSISLRGVSFSNPTVDQSAPELKGQIELERVGHPFLVHRDPDGTQHLTPLAERELLTIGRGSSVDLPIDGDSEISRLHAELERVGEAWVVADEGLSRNGTLVNGERVTARRRLAERDLLTVGATGILFRDPTAAEGPPETIAASGPDAVPPLGETQRRALVALCRPLGGTLTHAAAPATNQAIAEELFLSVNAVKAHLRVLFEKFGVDDLPQNQKRIALAEQALRSGAVHPSELG